MKKPPTNSSKQVKVKRSSTPSTQIPTPTQAKILAAKAEHPTLSTRKLGKLIDVNYSTVSKALARYGVDYGLVESYQAHRADIMDGLCHRIISSVSDTDINRATLLQKLSAYGIVYDKMRIERGLSDSASKPMVQINIVTPGTTVHSPVDNTCLLTSALSIGDMHSTQHIDNTNDV
jgi:hypothetical protein